MGVAQGLREAERLPHIGIGLSGHVRWCGGCRAAHGGWHELCPRCCELLGELPRKTTSALPAGGSIVAKRGRKARRYDHDGASRTLEEWASSSGIRYDTLRCRLGRGWSLERALSEPDHAKVQTARSTSTEWLSFRVAKLVEKIREIDVEIADLEVERGVIVRTLEKLRELCSSSSSGKDLDFPVDGAAGEISA